MERNPYFSQVASRYLFQEVRIRKEQFLERNPGSHIIALSIGDTTEPIAEHTCQGLIHGATLLGQTNGYVGYGPEQGIKELRCAISEKLYQGKISPEDIFISDGAKCDIGRLQILFGPHTRVALQDPAYPAYLDTSIIHHGNKDIIYLPCKPENNFFPDLSLAKDADIIFICSPNNPTGSVLTRDELQEIVNFARSFGKIIIFDSAYSFYVSDGLPRSIYEIEGAKDAAIEIGSFSKIAGFSGVRLGWTVVPSELRYATSEPVRADWMRLITTFYNGASYISQHGGLAALSDKGLEEIRAQVSFYLTNAKMLRRAFVDLGYEAHGGINSPYLWVRAPGKTSWQAFEELLEKAHIITTPGIGFGPAGDGFLRISGFAHRSCIEEAISRLIKTVNLSIN